MLADTQIQVRQKEKGWIFFGRKNIFAKQRSNAANVLDTIPIGRDADEFLMSNEFYPSLFFIAFFDWPTSTVQ